MAKLALRPGLDRVKAKRMLRRFHEICIDIGPFEFELTRDSRTAACERLERNRYVAPRSYDQSASSWKIYENTWSCCSVAVINDDEWP